MKKLKLIRRKKVFSQAEFANQMGVSQNTISQWENGARIPNVISLKKMAQILDCSTDMLLEDIETNERTDD